MSALVEYLRNVSSTPSIAELEQEEIDLINAMAINPSVALKPAIQQLQNITDGLTKTIARSTIDLQNDDDLKRYNETKEYLEKRGVKFVQKYSENHEKNKEIDHKSLTSILSWKRKFYDESSKCIEMVKQYINNKKECIMLHQMSNHCIHQQSFHIYSVIQCIRYIDQRLTNPEIYAPFHFSIIDVPNFIEWMDKVTKNKHHPFCSKCIAQFCSNQQLIETFLKHSEALGFWTCSIQTNFTEIIMAFCTKQDPNSAVFTNLYNTMIRPRFFEDKPKEDPSEKTVLEHMKLFFVMLEITEIWHRFMTHPQFVKYYLFKNMKLFQMFLRYFHSMRAIACDLLYYVKAKDFERMEGDVNVGNNIQREQREIIRKYCEYVLNMYNDITYCFYSMMQYLRKKHLKKKYLGFYINTISGRIGSTKLCDDNNYLCVLNLIWKKLSYKYNKYDVDISRYVPMNLIVLPLDDYDDQNLDDVIREKLKLKYVKCGNFIKCKQTAKSCKNMKLCSKCKMIYYCSRNCQKKCWKNEHRFVCHKIKTI